jgi:hypothetical protein
MSDIMVLRGEAERLAGIYDRKLSLQSASKKEIGKSAGSGV